MKNRSALAIVAMALLTPVQAAAVDTPAPGEVSSPATRTAPAAGSQGSQAPGVPAAGTTALANAKIQFTIGQSNVVRVPAETTILTATRLEGLEKLSAADLAKQAESITLVDRGIARGPLVRGTFALLKPEFVGRSGADGLVWRVSLKADVPLGTSHERMLSIDFGVPPNAQTFALEYTVSAKPAAAAQWTPRGATDVWTVSWSDPPSSRIYGVTIENPDEPLSHLRLAQSTLKDASGRTIGVDRLRLLDRPDAEPRSGIDIPANSAATVYIRLEAGAESGPFGTFDGVIRFTADGSPAMKDVSLKVQASSTCRRLLGIGLTLAGLLVTILISALVRPRMARLQAQRAAAAVRQSISQFELERAQLVPADVPTSTMEGVASRLTRSVSDAELTRTGLLPSRIALWWTPEAAADTTAALKAKLDEVSKVLEGLLVLLRSGFPRLLRLLPTNRKDALLLIQELDDFADRVTGPQDARAKVDDVHTRMPVTREISAPPTVREVSVADLDLRIENLSRVGWAVWALIALAVGSAWIVTDPDYGTAADLVSSFLWGFGVITFGAGIQNLTPGSVATQMNVKVPK